jgi:Domain of unknown function (DUF4388)
LEVVVSLKGSLETFALPEVLQLLADTSKTGELYVKGASGSEGRLWFRNGAVAAFDVESSYQPDDAIFELLGVGEGEFSFDADSGVPESAKVSGWDRQDVRSELGKAQAKMEEWVEILTVVPSLEHRVSLAAEAPSDHISVDRGQWEMLVAIGDGHSVQEVLGARSLGKVDGCRSIKGLVDGGLVRIVEAPQPQPIQELPAEPVAAAEGSDEVEAVDSPLPAPFEAAEPEVGVEDHLWIPAPEHAPFVSSPNGIDPGAVAAEDDQEDRYAGLRAALAQAAEAEDHEHQAAEAEDHEHQAAEAEDHEHQVTEAEQHEHQATELEEHHQAETEDHHTPEAEEHHSVASEAHNLQADDLYSTEEPADNHQEEPTSFQPGEIPSAEAEQEDDGHSALRALLAEVTAQAGDAPAEEVDGLVDRGPWTSHELASLEAMGGWHDDEGPIHSNGGEHAPGGAGEAESTISPYSATTAEADHAYAEAQPAHEPAEPEAEAEAAEEAAPADEPINRGLLLKFLSSVRN